MEDCIFCKIIAGQIPGMKIYEDEDCFAFLDIAKDADGHTLVVPKKHYKNLVEMDSKALHSVMDAVQKISAHYINDCSYEGVNLYNCCNECAGQTVMHFHMHIVPRKRGDSVKAWPEFGGAKNELSFMHEKLKMC